MECVYLILLFLMGKTYASLPLPSYFKPCARTDPNLNDCIRVHANEAIPILVKGDRKYKIPVLDPFEITEVKVDNNGPRNTGFAITLRDIKLYGLKDTKLEKANIDFDKKSITYEMILPLISIIGKYEMNGRIMVLPIAGNGDMNMTMENSRMIVEQDYTLENRNGEKFMKFEKPKTSMQPSRMYTHFSNLFNGDSLLQQQMKAFVDENWHEIFNELSPSFLEVMSQITSNIVNNVGRNISFDTMYPETLP